MMLSYSSDDGDRIEKPNFKYAFSINQTKFIIYGVLVWILVLFSLVFFINAKLFQPVAFFTFRRQFLKDDGSRLSKICKATNVIFKYVEAQKIVYYLVCIIVTLISFYKPLCSAFLLTIYIERSSTLSQVLNAFWRPRLSIGLTIVFLGCCIYWLTVFTYWGFHQFYADGSCNSLLNCFIINFDQTFKNGGGIGGYLDPAYSNGDI